MSKDLYINGPMFAGRLEGKINNVNKVVYLFGDVHYDLDYQTECESIESIDLHKYIFSVLKNKPRAKMIDIFFETYDEPTIPEVNSKKKYKYIWQIMKHFEKSRESSDKIISSNLRLHYIDFRNKKTPLFDDIYFRIEEIIFAIGKRGVVTNDDIKTIITHFEEMKDNLVNMQFDINKTYSSKDNKFGPLYYYFNKIIKKYNNQSLRKKLFDSEIYLTAKEKHKNMLRLIDEILTYLTKELTDNRREKPKFYSVMYIWHELAWNLYDEQVYYFVVLMDIYALRRLLDKDYVETSIIYAGFGHTCNYMYTLVKNFGFELTHVSSHIKLEEIKEEINKNSFNDFFDRVMPKEIHQCINLGNFPDDFI